MSTHTHTERGDDVPGETPTQIQDERRKRQSQITSDSSVVTADWTSLSLLYECSVVDRLPFTDTFLDTSFFSLSSTSRVIRSKTFAVLSREVSSRPECPVGPDNTDGVRRRHLLSVARLVPDQLDWNMSVTLTQDLGVPPSPCLRTLCLC